MRRFRERGSLGFEFTAWAWCIRVGWLTAAWRGRGFIFFGKPNPGLTPTRMVRVWRVAVAIRPA